MQIGKTLYVKTRQEWRSWLEKNYDKEPEIWVKYFKKFTGKPSIPYNDLVEEALCFGWIDSIVKGINEESYAQRVSPRKAKSNWSEWNKLRMEKLIKEGKMTPAGLAFYKKETKTKFMIPKDILVELKKDKQLWTNFQRFSERYKRVRIGWIDMARKRPEEFQKRLKYFLKMTSQNKMFGAVR